MKASCLIASLGAALLAAGSVAAQPFPAKSVRLIVPAAPGGGLDIMARVLSQSLAQAWGQPVVVDNRPGAGVMLGTEVASRAAPDGYTVLIVNSNLAPNSILHDKLAVANNLTGIGMVANLPNALSVPASVPVSSMTELIALAKSTPLTYGSAGHGTIGHICAEMLRLATGADIAHIPYKGGGPVMVALAGNQVSMGIVSLASTMSHMKAGRVKILAVSSGRRSRLAPDIPTISETVKGVELESWQGLLAPRGTPPATIAALNAAIATTLARSEVQKRLVGEGYELQASTPAEFDRLVQSDIAKYSRVIREAAIRID